MQNPTRFNLYREYLFIIVLTTYHGSTGLKWIFAPFCHLNHFFLGSCKLVINEASKIKRLKIDGPDIPSLILERVDLL